MICKAIVAPVLKYQLLDDIQIHTNNMDTLGRAYDFCKWNQKSLKILIDTQKAIY